MEDQIAYVANLERAISDVRLDAYRQPSDTRPLDVVARYLWNIALSESLYPTLQVLKVTLRNELYAAITEQFDNRMWFDPQSAMLHLFELVKVDSAMQELRLKRKPLEAGRIVAELSFGFWTSLFDKRYERILWPQSLRSAFPNMPRRIRTRAELSRRLNQIRRFRNRIFHHESVLNWKNPGLHAQHAQILEVITWMNPMMSDTIALLDRFSVVYSNGIAFYRSQVERHLSI